MKVLDELLIVCALLAAAIFGGYLWGSHDGSTAIQSEWDKDQALLMQANSELVTQHAIELQQLRDEHEKINLKTEYAHELALKSKDADLAAARADVKRFGGLRIQASCPTSGSTATSPETTGTGQRDGTITTSIQLPAGVEDGLWRLIDRADTVVEQARACQNWIKDNGFAEQKELKDSS